MQNHQLNLSYFSQKVEKRSSPIEGRGLFAKRAIKMGEVMAVKGGYILTRTQRDRIGRELGPSEIQITEDLFIGPSTKRQREGGMMHLNHSCEPNLGLQGQIVFLALRDIRADEEVTFDYAMTDHEAYEMKCRCGTPSCRGTITGFDWLKPEIQSKYDGYFSWFIQRRIDNMKRKAPRQQVRAVCPALPDFAAPNDGYHPRGRFSPAAPEAALAPHCRRSDARGLAGQVGRSDADEPVRTCTDECCNLIIVYQWAARSPPRAHEPETDTPGIHCNRRGEGYLTVCGQARGW